MNEFEILKEAMPKFDFKFYDNIFSALDNIFYKYKELFLTNKNDDIISVSRIISINDKDVNIEILCGYSDYETSSMWTDTVTIPIDWIIDEKYMADELRKKKEKEEREKAEKEKKMKEAKDKADYENYLRLKAKYESKGD
jgi:uncharacterized radical SAM superfamily Fe-S cluster-containing enzyme